MTTAFAFVFPGQGAQAVGMLDAWGDHPAVAHAIEEASDSLGEDLGALIHNGPKELLSLTANTQPVMLLAGVAAYRAWVAETGLFPEVVAGHSLGEYAALVASGVLSLTQAAPLVRLRGQAMQEAVPVGAGAMAAILGLTADQVVQGCAHAQTQAQAEHGSGEVVQAVNFNEPTQTVIAGTKQAVELACAQLKAAGAKRALVLPVSAPFHSTLMKPAAERLQQALAQVPFQSPQIRLLNNVDVATPHDANAIRDALVRQAYSPVRWVECIGAIKAVGVNLIVECGPGRVLSGLVKRIDAGLQSAAVYDPPTVAEVKKLVS